MPSYSTGSEGAGRGGEASRRASRRAVRRGGGASSGFSLFGWLLRPRRPATPRRGLVTGRACLYQTGHTARRAVSGPYAAAASAVRKPLAGAASAASLRRRGGPEGRGCRPHPARPYAAAAPRLAMSIPITFSRRLQRVEGEGVRFLHRSSRGSRSRQGRRRRGTSTAAASGISSARRVRDALLERRVLRLLAQEPGAVGDVAVLVLGDQPEALDPARAGSSCAPCSRSGTTAR